MLSRTCSQPGRALGQRFQHIGREGHPPQRQRPPLQQRGLALQQDFLRGPRDRSRAVLRPGLVVCRAVSGPSEKRHEQHEQQEDAGREVRDQVDAQASLSEVLIEALTLLSAASTVTVEPETYRAPGESSQTTAEDTSSTVPARLAGMFIQPALGPVGEGSAKSSRSV